MMKAEIEPGSVTLEVDVLTLNIPHKLCRCEVKDAHSLQSFVLTHSKESESAFHPLSPITHALASAFLKQNSAISLKKCVLVSKVFTTAIRKLSVNHKAVSLQGAPWRDLVHDCGRRHLVQPQTGFTGSKLCVAGLLRF